MKVLNKDVDLVKFFSKVRKKGLLLLDYDGTLSPFVKERMQAYPYSGVRDRLLALLAMKNTRMVIISGRSLSDLEKLLDLPGNLELWGSHGLERKLPNGKRICVPLDPKLKEGLDAAIKTCVAHLDPQCCEIKSYGVALHWRGIIRSQHEQAISRIEQEWKKISATYPLEMRDFDGGIELRPKGRNKGDVIHELLNEAPPSSAIAYLGDDLTDEDAFKALGEKGLKVLVREELRPTLADIVITPPAELLDFLDRWRGTE